PSTVPGSQTAKRPSRHASHPSAGQSPLTVQHQIQIIQDLTLHPFSGQRRIARSPLPYSPLLVAAGVLIAVAEEDGSDWSIDRNGVFLSVHPADPTAQCAGLIC